ncbi:MAG: hypothetical protein R3C01_00005, partial [Planctomycetaceae bacterium]
ASLSTIWQTLAAKDLNRPVRTRMPGGVGGAQPEGKPLLLAPRTALRKDSSLTLRVKKNMPKQPNVALSS